MSIYEKYGDFKFWHDTIYQLYLDMGDHPEISYHFIGVDLLWLSERQAEFLVSHIGGPWLYKGPSMAKIHERMGITDFQLREILDAFELIFEANGIEDRDVIQIMKVIGSYQEDIVTRKTSLIDEIMRPIYKIFFAYMPASLRKYSSWARSGKEVD